MMCHEIFLGSLQVHDVFLAQKSAMSQLHFKLGLLLSGCSLIVVNMKQK